MKNTDVDLIMDLFKKGFNCAQIVLLSNCNDFGLNSELAKKIAGGFGGGLARSGDVCGAVTGALMLIGLKYGNYKDDDLVSKDNVNKTGNDYLQMFKNEFGSIKCKDLIKYDLSIEDEAKKARESGIFKTLCPLLVKRSVELVENIL